jgi:hypothetical protein
MQQGRFSGAYLAQAEIRLLHGLNGRKPAEGGGKRRIKRENRVVELGKERSVRRNGTAAALVTPMAPPEPIYRGALK